PPSFVPRSTSASMARSAGRATFLRLAASPIALMKQADQPAANSCSGLVPPPAVPGDDSLTSRRPSELRDAPSRPPVVWAFAVGAARNLSLESGIAFHARDLPRFPA